MGRILNWKQAGLYNISCIRTTKIAKFRASDFGKKYGHLSRYDINELRKFNLKLESLNRISNDISLTDSFSILYGESISNNNTQKTYYYIGPVYRFGKIIDNIDDPIYTTAVSKAKAVNNFKSKLKKKNKLAQTAAISIDERNVMEVNSERDWGVDENRCSICGTKLNPLGECPVCDFGELDLLD